MLGPGGSFSYEGHFSSEIIFRELAVLSLDGIREFRLKYPAWSPIELHLSSFPSFEVFVIDAGPYGSNLSTVLPDPASSSLKTLVFPCCLITEGFMAELTQLASDRENATSVSLNRVILIEYLPTDVASIERLGKHVPVVGVMKRMELPKDLSWRGPG